MPELFGPRPDQYVPQVKLKRWNEIRTPRTTTLPGVPAHILRRQLLDIFDALDQGAAVWGHIDDFLEQIPEPYRGQLTMRVASSMCHIERRTGWRMPPEKFCAFLSNLPPHIKTWLTDGDHAFLGSAPGGGVRRVS